MTDTDSLRALHDTYVWEVNAAVGEDRMDLVWRLADEYADRALRLLTETESPGCDRADCPVCARSNAPSTSPRRRRWPSWARRRRAA